MVLNDPPTNRKTVTDGVEHLIADMVEEKGIDRGHKTEVTSAIAEEHGILWRETEAMLVQLLMIKILDLITCNQMLSRVIDEATKGAGQLYVTEAPRGAPVIQDKMGM